MQPALLLRLVLRLLLVGSVAVGPAGVAEAGVDCDVLCFDGLDDFAGRLGELSGGVPLDGLAAEGEAGLQARCAEGDDGSSGRLLLDDLLAELLAVLTRDNHGMIDRLTIRDVSAPDLPHRVPPGLLAGSRAHFFSPSLHPIFILPSSLLCAIPRVCWFSSGVTAIPTRSLALVRSHPSIDETH